MSRPKVLMISYLDHPSYYGLSRRISGLSRVLKRNDINVEVLCSRYRSLDIRGEPENIMSVDLRILRGANPERLFSKLVCLLLFTIFAVKHIIRNRKLWTVLQYESTYSSPPAIVAKLLTNALIIGDDLIIHERAGGRLLGALSRVLQMIPFMFTDVLITSSSASLRSLQTFAPGRCMYVPNGVNAPVTIERRDRVERSGKCVAVFVGAPTYAENRAAIEQLVRLPREMQDYIGRFAIWIVGGPTTDMRPELDGDFVKEGVIKFWGTVDDETLDGIYRDADVALLPFFEVTHESGGQRIKALECFARELVVVSTQAGVRGLNVTDGVHYIRVGSIEGMAKAFKEIIENPQKYSKLAARGRMHVAEFFSWEVVSRDYVELVRSRLQAVPCS